MVTKIVCFAALASAGWAIAVIFAVFRYHRAADGSLEENKRIGSCETVARISAGIGCFVFFGALFMDELTAAYIRFFNINPQAAFLGEILVTLTALAVGILHALASFMLCRVLAQASNYSLLRTVRSSPELSAKKLKQASAPPATKHPKRNSRSDASDQGNAVSDQPHPAPVYGIAEPTQIEPASQFTCTGPHFILKAGDLVAAMKDAGWRLNREPKPSAIPAPETTTINV